jgi:2-polyprenyl-3-methyl-5-hydroxy-6-metoxy-1,4-benzoquinol methylase
MTTPAYYHRINPDLLRLIPCNASAVLEVGCGAGALGAAYKRFNPVCRYSGIEPDPVPANEARQYLDEVWSGNVEEFFPGSLNLAEGSLDCIVFGGILQHLADPRQLLASHAQLLKDDGVILACIPNIQHWSILAGLMQGKWAFSSKEELPEKTQRRFFTLESMLEMFKASGLSVLDARARRLNQADFEKFYQAIEPSLGNLGYDKSQFRAQASALQYVIRASRTAVARPLLIQSLLLKPVAACNDVRVTQINDHLSSIPGVSIIQEVGNASLQTQAFNDKIFIWQRPILTHASRATLEKLVKAGYLVVVEFDDHPMRWPAIEQNDYLTFRGVHAVQTSTPELGDFFRRFNPEVAVFPNQLKEIPPWREPEENQEPLTLFFGALNREDDWKPLMETLNGVIRSNPGRLRFEVIHDRAFFDSLETDEKQFTPTCPYDRYREVMGKSDIALLPLADTEFNRMKSDLKFIEAAAHGVAVLASPTVYSSTIKDGENGMLFTNPEQFSARLQQLLDDFQLRKSLRRNAYQYVLGHRLLSQQIGQRLAWYRHLLGNRDELERLRLARLKDMPGPNFPVRDVE